MKIKIFVVSVFLVVAYFFSNYEKKIEKNNIAITRYRYIFKLPFSKKRTYIIKDINDYTGDSVTHIFDYVREKAYQFVNGVYNQTLGLYDVE